MEVRKECLRLHETVHSTIVHHRNSR
jgi:hypothetical protein